jgi:phosphate/phosphite/phosphonate ABC transporter binding protein
MRNALILVALFTSTVFAARRSRPPEPQAPITLGAVGYIKAETQGTVAPLVDYLKAQLGRPVRLVMYPSYNDILVQIGRDELDLAVLPPVVHMQVADAMPIKTLAFGVYPSGCFTYNAVILARKGDPAIHSLNDLKGKPVAFVDLLSASGYVYPKLMLEEKGPGAKAVIDKFYGNHVDALSALDAGEVAAAAVYDAMFAERHRPGLSIQNYQVLGTRGPIPSEGVIATKHLDPAIAQKVQEALLSFYANSRKPGFKAGYYTAFVPPDPSILEGVRTVYHKFVPEN